MHPHNAIKTAQTASRFMANPATEASRQKEYAFEMAGSSFLPLSSHKTNN
jgi:hypothetical protein